MTTTFIGTYKSEIVNLTKDNTEEKLKEHFDSIIKEIKAKNPYSLKITSKLEVLPANRALLLMELEAFKK
jgi:hypothetical protein